MLIFVSKTWKVPPLQALTNFDFYCNILIVSKNRCFLEVPENIERRLVMLNFAIIEDDEKILKNLYHYLESIFMQHDFDAEIGIHTTNVDSLLSYINKNKVDVLILDIDLNSTLSGLEIAKKVRSSNKDCYIIFETAHLEFGLMAYRFKTFDYISKPITRQRLEDCIIRLFEDVSGVSKRFIRIDNKNTIIAEKEIKYIKRDGMKIVFHTNSRDYEIYSSFSKIQDKLPENFVRCHKSFIANVDNITKVESTDNMVYFNNSCCEIGPKYKNYFLEVINKRGNFK